MKFLKYQLYEKVCSPNKEERDKYNPIWNKQWKCYEREFNTIKRLLPKSFLTEYQKHYLHDYILKSILIEKKKLKSGNKYDVVINLEDYYDEQVEHILKFIDISCLKTDFLILKQETSMLYNEFIKTGDRLSFEAILFDECMFYCEFSKLIYKRII